jgi:hypothetical protein
MQAFTHHDVLSTLLNTTFGRGGSNSGGVSITPSFAGDTLTLKYKTVLHFAEERSLQMQVDRSKQEAIDRLTAHVSELKKNFKEITGQTLRLKEVRSNDSLELVSGLSHRKVAYYRLTHVLEVA